MWKLREGRAFQRVNFFLEKYCGSRKDGFLWCIWLIWHLSTSRGSLDQIFSAEGHKTPTRPPGCSTGATGESCINGVVGHKSEQWRSSNCSSWVNSVWGLSQFAFFHGAVVHWTDIPCLTSQEEGEVTSAKSSRKTGKSHLWPKFRSSACLLRKTVFVYLYIQSVHCVTAKDVQLAESSWRALSWEKGSVSPSPTQPSPALRGFVLVLSGPVLLDLVPCLNSGFGYDLQKEKETFSTPL